jgi:hypothetical protein
MEPFVRIAGRRFDAFPVEFSKSGRRGKVVIDLF